MAVGRLTARHSIRSPVRRLTFPIALLAAGCGGGDGDDGPARAVTIPANGELRVVAKEYSFDPARVVVRGAGRLELTLSNKGSLAHNLKLLRDGEEVGGTPSFPGGRTESAIVNVEHGTYEMVCTVGDHAELGMTGELDVK
jgi:plastocyanin